MSDARGGRGGGGGGRGGGKGRGGSRAKVIGSGVALGMAGRRVHGGHNDMDNTGDNQANEFTVKHGANGRLSQ